MITIVLGEPMIPNLDAILDWFSDQGRPQYQRYGSHLLQWAGRDWIIRKGYDVGVINWRIEIEISDDDLETRFRNTWIKDKNDF